MSLLTALQSCHPDSDADAYENEHQRAPDQEDAFESHVANDREVVVHLGVAIEQEVPPAVDLASNAREPKHRERGAIRNAGTPPAWIVAMITPVD